MKHLINWEFITEKIIPVIWLWTAFILVGACVGVWLHR